jgi:hypothetical protein
MMGLLKSCMNNKNYYNSLESDIESYYDNMKGDFIQQLNKRSCFQTFDPSNGESEDARLGDPKPRKKVRRMSYGSGKSEKEDPETMIYKNVSD